MSLHLTAQYAVLVFTAAEWLLAGSRIATPPSSAETTASTIPAAQEWTIPGERLLVTNLVGKVTLGAGTGDAFVVRARLRGEDGALLKVEVEEGGDAELHVVYPLNDHSRYVYPELGNSRTQIGDWPPEARSSALREFLKHLSGRAIEVRGRSFDDAIEAWADLEILVPPSKATGVTLGVGAIDASGVQAPLVLDTKAGSIAATSITGDVVLDTGSGEITVRAIRGDAVIDTGSGSVRAEDLEGDDILIDTGSGNVHVEGVKARRVVIDTGSGEVDAGRIEADALEIDTGSGEVSTSDVSTSRAEIDTGSGSITLDLAALRPGQYGIETGSGSVTVFMPANASARIRASTGSGGIDVDLPAARVSRLSRNEISLEVGDAQADVVIDTGSGGIRIAQRP